MNLSIDDCLHVVKRTLNKGDVKFYGPFRTKDAAVAWCFNKRITWEVFPLHEGGKKL